MELATQPIEQAMIPTTADDRPRARPGLALLRRLREAARVLLDMETEFEVLD